MMQNRLDLMNIHWEWSMWTVSHEAEGVEWASEKWATDVRQARPHEYLLGMVSVDCQL